VSDGIATTDASVTWTVTGTNEAPVVTGSVEGDATENGVPVTLDALANASDVDDQATLSIANVQSELPPGVTFDPEAHAFTLDPSNAAYQHLAAGEYTTVTVSYQVSDGIATTDASVAWTVTGTNEAPVVTGAVEGDATENGEPVTLDPLANASDLDDGAVLSVTGLPNDLPAGVSFNAESQTFTLDPSDPAYQHLAADAQTTVTVNYGITDGIETTAASVSWTITGTNEAPV
jgi:VCBS repeat-containing protein